MRWGRMYKFEGYIFAGRRKRGGIYILSLKVQCTPRRAAAMRPSIIVLKVHDGGARSHISSLCVLCVGMETAVKLPLQLSRPLTSFAALCRRVIPSHPLPRHLFFP